MQIRLQVPASTVYRRRAHCLVVLAGLIGLGTFGLSADVRAQETGANSVQQQAPVMSQRQLYCLQLEQQLANESRSQQSARDSLPSIDAEIARADRAYQQGQAQADNLECFDYFLFSKEWRSTPRCSRLRQQIEGAQRALGRLQQQREQLTSGQVQQTRQDALITELARNQCGPQYVREAGRRTNGGNFFWDDSEGDPGFGAQSLPQINQTTYRTLCVRSCDGYYFPISFAATQQSFQRDANMCQAQCAAPARLFIYQNPGAEVEQAVAVDGEIPYSRLPNAFRYRRELVKGCSCKVTEYDPALFPSVTEAETATLAPAQDNQNFVPAPATNGLFPGDDPAVQINPAPVRKNKLRTNRSVEDLPKFLR